MIYRFFWGTVILFFFVTIIYVIYSLARLDEKVANCKGLVVKTPEGWVCSTAQKAS